MAQRFNPEAVALPHPIQANNADVLAATNLGFEAGDLLYWDAAAGYVKSANALAWDTDKPTTQRSFARKFVGVARKHVNKFSIAQNNIVDRHGEYAVDVASATYGVGDMLAVAKQAGGNALEAKTLEKTYDPDCAVFVVTRPETAAVTVVWAEPVMRIFTAQDAEPYSVSYSIAAEAADAIVVTLQLKDFFGNDFKAVRTFPIILADSATAGLTADPPSGAVAISGGIGSITEIVAKTHLLVTTDANGQAIISITEVGDDSWWMRALINNRLVTSAEINFAP